jgi:CheY-like chemotaxis protein
MSLQDALEGEGFTALEAKDAVAALRSLDETPSIELMITDVKMPGMDGLELANVAAARFPDLRIIIMSGHADAHDARIPPGAHFMRKPFPLLPFVDWIRASSGEGAARN